VTADALLSRGADQPLGNGRRFEGSSVPLEIVSTLAFRLPVSWADDRWGALAPNPVVVLRLPASKAGFFFRRYIAIHSSSRISGEIFIVDASAGATLHNTRHRIPDAVSNTVSRYFKTG